MAGQRIALVTEGIGGLGEAIAVRLLANGVRVVVTHSEHNDHVAQWFGAQRNAGREFTAFPVDVTDFASCLRCVSHVRSEVGDVDILINNAGVTRDRTLRKMDKADWDFALRTDLDSLFHMTRRRCQLGGCVTLWAPGSQALRKQSRDFGCTRSSDDTQRISQRVVCDKAKRATDAVLGAKCCRIGPKFDRNTCVRFGSRNPRMRRSRSRVGWWLFSARLFTRAAALTNTWLTFASSAQRCGSHCRSREPTHQHPDAETVRFIEARRVDHDPRILSLLSEQRRALKKCLAGLVAFDPTQ